MDFYKQGMKGPTRPAPTVPGVGVTRYSPITNWDTDPFGADLFEPTPNMQKKKPPPRPPPPKVPPKQPEIPAKPSHFIRKPTVLSSLLSRKTKSSSNTTTNVHSQQMFITDLSEVDATKIFPKCEPKIIQTGALIDLSSPPSSPTFTTRSSSDGLSVDSFGSDATTSTNHHNNHNGGNASQAESGFEDDFDLFLNTRKIVQDDTMDSFPSDPFSPQPMLRPPILKKPVITKDLFESSQSKPTIIRAKPARPKPPDNSSLLKNTFGGSFPAPPVSAMTVNTTTPLHKINGGFGDSFDSKPFSWDDDRSPDRESSPPMPSIPPPPPPDVIDDDLPEAWPCDTVDFTEPDEDIEPYGIALFDYFTDHPEDLCFSVNSRVKLIRRVDNEWLYGRLRNGTEGTFPSNYIDVKIPLPDEKFPSPPVLATAVALYNFTADQPGDLRFLTGDTIVVQYKLNDEWYFGECNGSKGQFPINYVRMS